MKNSIRIFLGSIEVRSARHRLRTCRNWKNSTYCRGVKKNHVRSKVPILFVNYRYITVLCLIQNWIGRVENLLLTVEGTTLNYD